MMSRFITRAMVMKEFACDKDNAQKFIDLGIVKGWVVPRGEDRYEVVSKKIVAKAEAIIAAREADSQ